MIDNYPPLIAGLAISATPMHGGMLDGWALLMLSGVVDPKGLPLPGKR